MVFIRSTWQGPNFVGDGSNWSPSRRASGSIRAISGGRDPWFSKMMMMMESISGHQGCTMCLRFCDIFAPSQPLACTLKLLHSAYRCVLPTFCPVNPNQTDVWEALPGLGGGSGSPPLLSWLWSKFLLKNHVSLKAGINSNSFGPFLEIFFKNHQKNRRKLKIHQKMAKYERNF